VKRRIRVGLDDLMLWAAVTTMAIFTLYSVIEAIRGAT